jgi:hypothetical protein
VVMPQAWSRPASASRFIGPGLGSTNVLAWHVRSGGHWTPVTRPLIRAAVVAQFMLLELRTGNP